MLDRLEALERKLAELARYFEPQIAEAKKAEIDAQEAAPAQTIDPRRMPTTPGAPIAPYIAGVHDYDEATETTMKAEADAASERQDPEKGRGGFASLREWEENRDGKANGAYTASGPGGVTLKPDSNAEFDATQPGGVKSENLFGDGPGDNASREVNVQLGPNADGPQETLAQKRKGELGGGAGAFEPSSFEHDDD